MGFFRSTPNMHWWKAMVAYLQPKACLTSGSCQTDAGSPWLNIIPRSSGCSQMDIVRKPLSFAERAAAIARTEK